MRTFPSPRRSTIAYMLLLSNVKGDTGTGRNCAVQKCARQLASRVALAVFTAGVSHQTPTGDEIAGAVQAKANTVHLMTSMHSANSIRRVGCRFPGPRL